MTWNISILRRAQRDLDALHPSAYARVRDAIRNLAADSRPHGCVKPTGRDGWRIRAGDYRVVYEIDDQRKSVVVMHVGHRRDVYR